MYPIGSTYFVQAGVPIDELDKAYHWAFGDDCMAAPVSEMGDRWRRLHPELPTVNDSDEFEGAMRQIAREFLKHKEQVNECGSVKSYL